MGMNYIGEHLIFGFLGKSFISFSFLCLVISLFFYVIKKGNFSKAARLAFVLHFVFVLSASFILFYIIFKHYFEYKYVWQYSSLNLPLKYIISCFWAGQEGSFLVWAFWQGLLGLILLKTSKELERYVLPVVIIAQLFILSMITGWNMFGIQIGSSPFILLRETINDISGTIFARPDYLNLLGDGNGLNPLLENIWMVSHPPVLFLGYASVLIPYAFALSYFVNRNQNWTKYAYKWVVFSEIALGTGLILGGRWAYESLTFGGFWAWDPVENASLVPWLVLLAGQHLLLVAKNNESLLKYPAWVLLSSFILVIYSSYLTRSGILGSTSVHSFSANGTSIQLLTFLFSFVLLPLIAVSFNKKVEIDNSSSFRVNSKNFWIVSAIFILLLSAFQVFLTTSLPVIAKLTGINFAPPLDVTSFYAKWQTPFAILLCLSLVFQNLNLFYKNRKTLIIILLGVLISLIFSYFIHRLFNITDLPSILLTFTSILLIFSVAFSNKFAKLPAIIAHFGIGVFFLGIIIAFNNPSNIVKSADNSENSSYSDSIILEKDTLVKANNYYLKYFKHETIGSETFYHIEFYNSSLKPEFIIKPSVNRNPNFGNVYNPSTKHLFTKDIFTHIINAEHSGGYKLIKEAEVTLNDSLKINELNLFFNNIKVKQPENDTNLDNVEIIACFTIKNASDKIDTIQISYIVKNGLYRVTSDVCFNDAYKITFKGLAEKANTIIIELFKQTKDVVVIKSTIFGYIILLWAGAILILFGLLLILIKKELKAF